MRYGRRIAYCFRCDPGAVQREKQPLLDTLRELVSIESGSSDFDGVTRIDNRIAERLRALGGEVEKVPPASGYAGFQNTPERLPDTVVARFRGKGAKRILLLARCFASIPFA
jgi:glutamate carboxypeptidase